MTEIKIVHQDGDAFTIFIRDHVVHVDVPRAGGYDSGPTPLELFVASIAACIAHYARRHLKDHGLPHTGLEVGAGFTMITSDPQRVTSMSLDVRIPWKLSESEKTGLLNALNPCPVLASLQTAPDVSATVTCAPTAHRAEPAPTPMALH
ncbi:hypothetical protein GCM10022221_65470 [Actinocorallia aurea]